MKQQRGGTILGFIIGVVVGLAIALGVAVYVTKVPIPFINKASSRTAEQDANETQKNKDWDPNTPLYGKNPVKPAQPGASASTASTPAAASSTGEPPAGAVRATPAMLATAPAPVKPEPKTAASADPLGDLAKARTTTGKTAATAADAEPFTYFVQVGAFRTPEDAEGQRAKMSLAGIETKISEREQSGRMVYRVRVGPFDKREEADKAKAKLESTGIETALVRVQR